MHPILDAIRVLPAPLLKQARFLLQAHSDSKLAGSCMPNLNFRLHCKYSPLPRLLLQLVPHRPCSNVSGGPVFCSLLLCLPAETQGSERIVPKLLENKPHAS